jgi:hypothetical protein
MIREYLKELTVVTGRARRLPNGVSGLSPQNPALKIINSVAITPYWSSHLDGAKSELIVPGLHGSFNSPQKTAELQRMLVCIFELPAPQTEFSHKQVINRRVQEKPL